MMGHHQFWFMLRRLNQKVLGTAELSTFRTVNVHCIDREGNRLEYFEARDVEAFTFITLQNLESDMQDSQCAEQALSALALAWLSLMKIHPFENGNGRTLKLFVHEIFSLIAPRFSLQLQPQLPTILDTLILNGYPQEEFAELQRAFIQHYQRRKAS
jgi:hypothetical protein